MLRLIVTATLLFVSGCSTANIKEVLDNLDKDCVRHYTFSASTGVPATGTIAGTVDCQPSGKVAPTSATPAPTP